MKRVRSSLLRLATVVVCLLMAPAPAEASTNTGQRDLDQTLDAVTAAGVPGAFAEVRVGGQVWRGGSGVAELGVDRPARPWFAHRVGSITKTFTATTVLQLVGEAKIDLDAPIGHYLRGLPLGSVGATVTVRMLLNQTSGIADYDTILFATPEDVERGRTVTYTPRQLAALGLSAPATHPPGSAWAYSNTNYILAGLIIEHVTGRDAAAETSRRIIRPLGLHDTYFAGTELRIRGPHARGYVPWPAPGELRDFTDYNMSWAGMGGALISTPHDVNRFLRALFTGRLLRPAELDAMRTTVPTDPANPGAGRYGLGIARATYPCGDVWWHDGIVYGHAADTLLRVDGSRQVTLATTLTRYHEDPAQPAIDAAKLVFLTTAVCGT